MLIAFFTAFFRSRSLITPVTNQVSLVNRFISHFFSLLLFISLPSLAAVTSISGPANGTYNSNDSLKFVVSFSESINYTPAEDSTSYLILALDSGLAYAEYQSISANKVTFSYTPTAKDFDFDGNIGFNGFYQFEVSSFGVTNGDEKLNVDKVANLSAVFIEHSNIADFPDNDLYLPGDMLTFSLRWRGISTVAITGGTPQLTININNTLHVINAVAAGQGRIDFNYPINNFDIDTDGIKIESFQLNNATIFGTLDGTQDNSVGSHVLTVANTNFVNNSLTSKVTLLSNNSSAVLVGEAIIPKVTSVDVPVAGDYVTGNSISFTVHFDQAVQTSDPASTKLRIKLDNEREILANYASASGAQTSWKFDYSLTLDDIDRNGIELVALESDGGFVSDTGAYLFSDWHDLPLNNIGDTSKITFNLISLLQIVSVDMPNSGGYFTGDVLNFTVNFANNITVTGQPLLHLTIGNKQIIAQYVSGSGTSALVFSYQITEQLVNSDDISLGKFDLNGATLLSESESEGNSDGSYINNPPLTIEDTASLDEDGTIVIAVLDNDVDAEGFLIASSIVVLNQPTNGQTSVDTINGVITYTPFANFNGTDTFTYQVADFQGATSLSTLVTISINAVNDLPTLNDDLALSQEDSPVLVDVLKNDSDIDVDDQLDAGSLVILNEPTNGQAQVVDGKINYSPRTNFNGSDSFSYQVADSFGALGEAATVTLNISNSNDAPITNELESQEPPQLSLPEAISFDATALYTRVNLGIASATDYLGNSLPVLLDGTPFYKPGNNVAVWTTKDAAGRTARAEQQVNIRPLISLDKDQTVVEGERVTIKVLLNGHSPVYPLTIPYTVSGSATTGLDHDLSDGDIIVESGTEAEISFNILRDSQTDVENNAENEQPNKDIIITLDPSLNRGQKVSQQILISQENIAPRVALSAIQNSIQTLTVTQVDGLVTVNLSFTDPDSSSDNEHVIDWSDSDLSLTNQSSDELIYIFDPASLSKGLYRVSVTVTDVQGLSNTDFVSVKIIDTLPTLTTMDSDGDGIADNEEGYFDQDGDGIPDYQDTITACNILPQTALSQSMLSQTGDNQQQFLVEGELGSCLQLGNIASLSDNASAQLDPNDILTDGSTDNIGGVFDFIVKGLGKTGQSYNIVLPQLNAIPIGAMLRKLGPNEHGEAYWRNFVEIGETDVIRSAKGERGYCPPPGDGSEWTPGLSEGDWCIQLTLRDGGPNDDDGVENGVIVDPVAMVVPASNNQFPEAVDDVVNVTKDTSQVQISILDNDLDADGDMLSVTSINADLGIAVIQGDSVLYTAPADYIGSDRLIYNISDGNGGSASATVTVLVVDTNQLPLAQNDTASTNDMTDIMIDVLANDSDDDNDILSLDSVSTSQGQVQVIDNQLQYSPEPEYVGSARIEYTITDGQGGFSGGVLQIDISQSNRAPEAVADSATTTERNNITIDILANDTDLDGDNLTISFASAQQGVVSISNNQLVYQPKLGFDGNDLVNYTITDGNGGESDGTVDITVDAIPETKSGSGGSMGMILIMLLGLTWIRCYARKTQNGIINE